MANSIWCLFTINDDYYQPDNNLERFWFEKPSIETFAAVLGYPLDKAKDEHIVKVVACWQGQLQHFCSSGPSYRLQEVKEGEAL